MSEQPIDILWVLLSAALVALMQPGFTALEAGATRAKNSISTAIKNISDFFISFIIFVTFGASIMLGDSLAGWIGWAPIFFYEPSLSDLTMILFQAMFASTAVTIISGAIAERTKYISYLLIAMIISLLVYPVQAHWAWNEQGWLAQLGFIDFAGSTVVHSVGGWAALAAILIIGPRLGRFDDNASQFEHANLANSALGIFLIWLGWIGFNGGSVLALDNLTGLVILNTLIAGSMGGIGGLLFSRLCTGYFNVNTIMYGILSGLVAITASAHLASPVESMLIGLVGLLAYETGRWLLIRYQIDDAIEAVPVHLFAGIIGTLAVPFVMDEVHFWTQLKVQLIGITAIGALSFGLTYVLLRLIHHFFKLRVSESDEILGLNISEHKASTSMFDLAQAMNQQAQSQNFTHKILVEPYSDASLIAAHYNHVIQAFNQVSSEKEALIKESYKIANYDHLTGLAKRRLFVTELERAILSLQKKSNNHAILFIDLDGFKGVNDHYGHDAGDIVLKSAAIRIQKQIRQTDLASRFGGDEFVILLESIPDESFAAQVADDIIEAIADPIALPHDQFAQVRASIGLKIFDDHMANTVDDILKQADKAMYIAKKRGKGQWVTA